MAGTHRGPVVVVIGILFAPSFGCAPPSTVAANPGDLTPPSTLWLQADIPGRPLANVSLGQGHQAFEIAGNEVATVTARADDNDGGLRSIRLLMRARRPRPGNAPLASFVFATATTSSATPGSQTSPSARVSMTINGATLAATTGSFDGGIEIVAEAENFAGQVIRSPVMSLCLPNRRLRVHVVPLSDDDGTHAPQVTPAQFSDALQLANRAFCGTGIQFQFDPATAWAPLSNSGMNKDQTIGTGGAQQAAARPNRVVLLLRWGSDPANHTGNGNAYPPPGATPPRNFNDVTQDYVALPSVYSGANSLTIQNGSFLAHELGHYLGLYHTFPGWDGINPMYGVNPTVASQAGQLIVTYVRGNGGTTDALDGDGLADTPPDPNGTLHRLNGQNPCLTARVEARGSVGGSPFTYVFIPDVANAMSYYDTCDNDRPKDFSPQQVARMHLTLGRAPRNALLVP